MQIPSQDDRPHLTLPDEDATDEMPSHHGIEDPVSDEAPNVTLRLLRSRASCRNFSRDDVSETVMNHLYDAAVHSPTGGNLQPFSIIEIRDPARRQKLAGMCTQRFMARAPVHLLFCIDWWRLKRWADLGAAPFSATASFRHFWISFQDTIIAAQNLCTAAEAMGLGSVYIGTIIEFFREAKQMFNLPEGVIPAILLCVGVPKKHPVPRRKLEVSTIVHRETYQDPADPILEAAFARKYEGQRVSITEKRLAAIETVCRRVHGEAFARRCLERIREQGYISQVQHYFGLHYDADGMAEGNDEFLNIIEEFGFDWFKRRERQPSP